MLTVAYVTAAIVYGFALYHEHRYEVTDPKSIIVPCVVGGIFWPLVIAFRVLAGRSGQT